MSKRKELEQIYGGRRPKTYLPAHNHVIHTARFRHGWNGFRRFWIPPQWVSRGWSKCPCGWRAYSWGDADHYAHTDHTKWWREQIKKRGSLDAVYRYIEKRLARKDRQ